MSKLIRGLVMLSLVLELTFNQSMLIVGHADPVQDGLESSSGLFDMPSDLTNQSLDQNISNYIDKVNQIDDEISKNTVEVEMNTQKISSLSQDIEVSEDKIKEKDAEMRENLKLASGRIRALSQRTPQMELLANLFEAKNLSDFFSRVDLTVKVVKYDNSIFAQAKQTQEDIKNLKKDLETSRSQVSELLAANQEKVAELTAQKEQLVTTLNELKASYAGQVLQNQSEQAHSYENMLKEKFKTYVSTNLTNQPSYETRMKSNPGIYGAYNLDTSLYFTDDDIVMYGSTFLDVPYLWGGTTPQGFDCSGFVQYVYAHFGIYLPRVSEDQQNVGTVVTSESDLQPGDLLFYGAPAHHVTLYIAPGLMMEAPHTGDIVKVSSIRPYTKAMRVVNWSKVATPNKLSCNISLSN